MHQLNLLEIRDEHFVEWTDDMIADLRLLMLKKFCSWLVDPDMPQREKMEILGWVKDDSVAPFSFRVCCISEGADPDEYREKLICHVKQHMKMQQTKASK